MVVDQLALSEKLRKSNPGLDDKSSLKIVKDLFGILFNEISAGNDVVFKEFGRFHFVTRKEKKGQSGIKRGEVPKTVIIPEHKTVKFTPSGRLKAQIRKLQ